MSKIESGKVDLLEEPFSLSELIGNLETMLRPSVQEKQHTLRIYFTWMLPFIRRTMFCAIVMPSPVPSILLTRESSARLKGSKIHRRYGGGDRERGKRRGSGSTL